MPRFVILTHDHPCLHWDLMLESGSALRTWRLLMCPDESGPIPAESLPAHRLHYLDYEGPVSGDRGSVTRWDFGEYELSDESESLVRCRLSGNRLRGDAVLQRESTTERWTFRYSPAAE